MNDELSDLNPLDPEEHARQLAGVLELATVPSRIVDLGAGSGRMAVPLANAGASVLAVDLDPVVFESDDWSRGEGVTPLVEDILAPEGTWHQQGFFQAALWATPWRSSLVIRNWRFSSGESPLRSSRGDVFWSTTFRSGGGKRCRPVTGLRV